MTFKELFKKKQRNNKALNKKGGFTLIETFVAIVILMLAVTGPLSIAQKSLSSAEYSQDQVTAYYLAQDALEYVIQLRDTNTGNGDNANGTNGDSGWLSGIPDSCFGGTCRVDTTQFYALGGSGGLSPCSVSAGSCLLSYNASSGLYSYQGGGAWQPSQFTRTITFTADSDHELTMTVDVTWRSTLFSTAETYTASEHLFNWQ